MKAGRLLLFGMFLIGGACTAVAWGQGVSPRARLISMRGVVRMQRGGHGAWAKVTTPAQRILFAGDHLQTLERSRAVIAIDGAKVIVGPLTSIIIPAPHTVDHRVVSSLWVTVGRVFLWLVGTREMDVGSQAAIAAASGTRFGVAVAADGTTVLTVTEGHVDFHNQFGRVLVAANQQSTAKVGAAPTPPTRADVSGYLDWQASAESLRLDWDMRFVPGATREKLQQSERETATQAERKPQEAALLGSLGDLKHDLGDLPGAVAAYQQALQIKPDDSRLLVRLGFSLLAEGQLKAAGSTFAQAAQLTPAAIEATVGTALVTASRGTAQGLKQGQTMVADHTNSALALAAAGFLAMQQGEADTARNFLHQALQLDANLYQAHALLALVNLNAGQTDQARQAADQALALAPSSGMACQAAAAVQFYAGDLVAAQVQVTAALQDNPDSAVAHLLQSDLDVARGDLVAGLREAQLAVTLDPMLGPAYSALGMIYLADNELPQAERGFKHALTYSPNLMSARTGLGATYLRQGKVAAALNMQEAAVALNSTSPAVHNNLGVVYLSTGQLHQAVAEFQRAIELQPSWSMAHANLALAYLELNEFSQAVSAAQRAVQLGENSARVYTTLARVYLKQNRNNLAQVALRKALQLDDHYALAHLEMAEVYNRLGDTREALQHQLRGLSTQPSAMVDDRDYARTEATVEGGSLLADLKQDGRTKGGQSSFFLHAAREQDDGGRPHSDWQQTSGVGILGRQTGLNSTDAAVLTYQREDSDRPGRIQADGSAEDPDFSSVFSASEFNYLGRRPLGDHSNLTFRLGYQDVTLRDENPDSLNGDPRPYLRSQTETSGPSAEVRLDASRGRSQVIAGAAYSGDINELDGIVGTPNPSGAARPVRWTPYSDKDQAHAGTFYLWYLSQCGPRTSLLAGGRMATRQGMQPVLRPEAYLRYQPNQHSTVVLLTRPLLRDDVSELSPVDDWALRDWMSPLDLATGGFSQSYELTYQTLSANGSLLRLAGFYRTLRNYLVNFEDPAWSVDAPAQVFSAGSLRGVEGDWERWLGRDLTGSVWVRYTDSRNDEAAGNDIPYQPQLLGQARLDYLDPKGVRLGVVWQHVGRRYADTANSVRLGSYNTFNLLVARQYSVHTDAFVTIDDVFDQSPAFWEDYPGPGRKIRAGLLYRF